MPRTTPIPMPVELPPSPTEEIPSPDGDKKAKIYSTHLRLALGPWAVHFKYPGYMKEETMQMLETRVVRRTIERTKKNAEVREELGTDISIWIELGELIDVAVPSLEQRCFTPPSPQDPDYEVLSGTLIAQNYTSLLKDLERLHCIVLIARNILIVGERAQSLCAKAQFDQEMFRLINVCVKVAARGYDGEPGNPDQKKFDTVVDAFKHLLICSLQFLNNLTSRNERRKLMLWVELFDGSPEPSSSIDQLNADPGSKSDPADIAIKLEEDLRNTLLTSTRGFLLPSEDDANLGKGAQQPASSPFLLFIGKTGMEVKRQLIEQGQKAGAAEIAAECKRRWQSMSEDEKKEWDDFYKDLIERYREGLSGNFPNNEATEDGASTPGNVAALARSINQLKVEVEKMRKSILAASKGSSDPQLVGRSAERKPSTFKELEGYLPITSKVPEPPSPKDTDFHMEYTASYGADILQKGKDDLMKRLQSYSDHAPPASVQVTSPTSPLTSPISPNTEHPDDVLEEGSEEEDDSEDDDYVVPGDDGRGLLTDVPLILAPGEIEVLPMIIMSGVVPPEDGKPGSGSTADEVVAIKNMHTVRCHLLLAHENGRNLLRELLIFVAAWDLREEELYFKMMVKIMEAILTNALMPFSYHAFRESKDIISPAQAVIMKLLTNIFRTQQTEATARLKSESSKKQDANHEFPLRVHVQMVKFLFTEFRRQIIPQTCALIFLQGQIRAGHFSPDEFPLNLWDMERMYEGVYQYLEFFAILTEHELWKKMMADWDITSEMVTLLLELDAAIPKGQLPGMPPIRTEQPSTADQIRRSTEAAAAMNYDPQGGQAAPLVAVERPYDVAGQDASSNSGASASTPAQNPLPPGAFLNDVGGFGADSPADEPSDFEWRNLKKLAVLVLSSLVWKSRTVQDQVRNHGGIDAILNCCAHDEHNPYIREHAIMCLRFLLEGNKENQDVIRQLEPQGVVPSEVLDQHGYETFMDAKGQVGLRRKEVLRTAAQQHAHALPPTLPPLGPAPQPPASALPPTARITPKDPKDLADLVQSMMKDLPAMKEKLKMDPESLAKLAKLDKKFEESSGRK